MIAIALDTDIRVTLSGMIRRAFEPFAAKIAARYADASPRTVEDWLQGRTSPSGTAVLRMCRNEAFRAEMRAWCDECERQENYIREQHKKLGGALAFSAVRDRVSRDLDVDHEGRRRLSSEDRGQDKAVTGKAAA